MSTFFLSLLCAVQWIHGFKLLLQEQLKSFQISRSLLKCAQNGLPPAGSIEDLLNQKFVTSMQNNRTTLFSSFSNFKRSLPMRRYGAEYLPLYTLGYYAREKSLQEIARAVMIPSKLPDGPRLLTLGKLLVCCLYFCVRH